MKKRERNSRMRRAAGLLALWLCVVMGMSMTLLSYAEAAQGGSDIEGAESQTGLSEEVFLTGEEGNSADEANAAGLDEEADEMAAINEEDESEDPTDTELDGSAEDTGEAELDGSAEDGGEAEIDGSAEGAGEAEGVAEDVFDMAEEDPDGNQDEEAMTDSSEAAGSDDVEVKSDEGESGEAAEGDNDPAEVGDAEEAENHNPMETGNDVVGSDELIMSDDTENGNGSGEFETGDHADGASEVETEDHAGGADGIDEAAGKDAWEESEKESEDGYGAGENAGASEEGVFPETEDTEDAFDSAEDGDGNGEDPGLLEDSEAEEADDMSGEEETDEVDADSSGNDEAGLFSEEAGISDAEVPAEEAADGTDASVEEAADVTDASAEEAGDGTDASAEEAADGTEFSTEENADGTDASAEEAADGSDASDEETAAEGFDESGELLSEEAEVQDPSETSEAEEEVLEGEGQKSAGGAEKGTDGQQTDQDMIISYKEYLKNKAEKDSAGLMEEEEEEAAELMATQSKVAYIPMYNFWRVARYITGHCQYNSSNYNLHIDNGYYYIDLDCSVPEVTSFQRTKALNSNLDTYDVSGIDSEYEIWINFSNGVLQWYSDADVIKFTDGDMSLLFNGFTGLQRVDFDGIDASEVTNMQGMFQDCSSLLSFDLTGFDTRKVKSMEAMFYGCSDIRAIDLSMLETRELENVSGMFYNCSSLNAVKLSGQFTTARVTDMSFMFRGCSSLKSMDLSAFDTRNCTTMQAMFYNCEDLASLTLGGKFITSNVEQMVSMFEGCKSLAALNLGTFNTAKVKDMTYMFKNCEALTSLDLSSFDTSRVTDMPEMFYQCYKLQTLTLGDGFNTEHCIKFDDMFSYCGSLRTIYAGDGFVTSAQANEYEYMFTSCDSLVGGNGTRYDDQETRGSYAHIDVAGNPGYFTRYWAVRVSNVTISSTASSVAKGATLQLTASVSPSNATEKGMSWTSSNAAVATVASGQVTGVSLGTAVITVTTTDGKKTASCTVTVTESINSDTISLAQKSFTYDGTGKTPAVTLVHNGKTLVQGQNYNVSYSSNVNAGTAVATVTGIGYYTGTRTIKFKITKAAQKLTITAPKKNAALSVGTKQDITVSGAQGKLSFKSSASTVAAVTSKGVLKAKKVGKATITITAKATDNYKAASVKLPIKVTPAKTSSLTLTMQASGVKLSWKKVAGATGYYVYRNGKKAATIKKASTVSYVDKKAKSNGAKYQYQIYAYASTGKGAASAKKTIYFLTVPKITGVRNSRGGNIDIGWKQNQKATGYQVKYVVDGIEKTKTIKKAATVSATLGNLDIGDTYKISVRAYKTVGSTNYYSPWSAVKKVKVVK